MFFLFLSCSPLPALDFLVVRVPSIHGRQRELLRDVLDILMQLRFLVTVLVGYCGGVPLVQLHPPQFDRAVDARNGHVSAARASGVGDDLIVRGIYDAVVLRRVVDG